MMRVQRRAAVRVAVSIAVLVLGACSSSAKKSEPPASTTTSSVAASASTAPVTSMTPTTASVPTTVAAPTTLAPPTTTVPPAPVHAGAFAGHWIRHGANVDISANGAGSGLWRIYSWCQDDPTPPCDAMQGNVIISGGHADFRITAVRGDQAVAVVTRSSDSKLLPNGTAQLQLLSNDRLKVGGLGTFCGPRSVGSPCGA